ncbi:hypothetical protein ACIP98_22170 [Streptomyces sp. NPDC088354]|uniref:hypothetical protein n=1 Tax=Streptomyces sp. NPDC088354 TaxID=3365856 RepID=UPI003826D495
MCRDCQDRHDRADRQERSEDRLAVVGRRLVGADNRQMGRGARVRLPGGVPDRRAPATADAGSAWTRRVALGEHVAVSGRTYERRRERAGVEHGPTPAMFYTPDDPRTADYVEGRSG